MPSFLFSDRGTPDGYRHMDGFSSHTYSLINDKSELFYVKWHFKNEQGIKNFTRESADDMRGKDPDHAQRDLFNTITIVPEMAVEKKSGCRFMRIADAEASRTIGAVVLRGRSLTRLHRAFWRTYGVRRASNPISLGIHLVESMGLSLYS